MDYFKRYEENPYQDLEWNIPEQKQGAVSIIGGNVGNFRTEIKVAEFLGAHYPVDQINVVLPDALRGKLPELPNLRFLTSTETGSFAEEEELTETIAGFDFNLVTGDLSKNTITGRAVAGACENSARPLLITRDAVDMVAENMHERLLMNKNLIFFASVAQLQKLLRAAYYPKMLMMSQSLVQATEVLHKFTLSYPVAVITLHNEQILVAMSGTVAAVSLAKSGLAPFKFWNGELAAKVVAFNLYNPHNLLPATIAAIYQNMI